MSCESFSQLSVLLYQHESLPLEGVKIDILVTGADVGQLPFALNFSNCEAASFSFLIAFFSVGLDLTTPLAWNSCFNFKKGCRLNNITFQIETKIA